MKILVIGGSGRVAASLVTDLVAAGHDVYVGSRHVDTLPSGEHIHPLTLDLTSSKEALSQAIPQVDIMYFVAGSRGHDLLQVDAFGPVKMMQIAQAQSIKRFIMLSSVYSLTPSHWDQVPASLGDYQIAKFFADTYLMTNTDLTYTILQATALTETTGTGKISLTDQRGTQNTISDVAATLAALLEYPNTENKVITMSNGQTPINEALRQV